MKRGMTFEDPKCRVNLNFEVDFGVNDAIDAIVIKWDLSYSDNESFSSITYIFLNTLHSSLSLDNTIHLDNVGRVGLS